MEVGVLFLLSLRDVVGSDGDFLRLELSFSNSRHSINISTSNPRNDKFESLNEGNLTLIDPIELTIPCLTRRYGRGDPVEINFDFHPCQRPTVRTVTTEHGLENTVSLISICTLPAVHRKCLDTRAFISDLLDAKLT